MGFSHIFIHKKAISFISSQLYFNTFPTNLEEFIRTLVEDTTVTNRTDVNSQHNKSGVATYRQNQI